MKGDGFYVDTTSFGGGLKDLSRLNNKSQAENLQGFARTMLTNRDHSGLIDITPPAGHGSFGHAAKMQGEHAIERDLSRVFIGVALKHERTEQHPDVEALHLAHLIAKRPGSPMRPMKGVKYYVDATKLRALFRKLKGHVGRLASAWLVSAHRLGVRGPAWVERHGPGAGECNVQLQGPKKEIEMAIYAPDSAPVQELERRVLYAERYTAGRLFRAIEGAVLAAARKAGFRTL